MFKLEISTGGAAFRDPFSGEEDEVMEARKLEACSQRYHTNWNMEEVLA